MRTEHRTSFSSWSGKLQNLAEVLNLPRNVVIAAVVLAAMLAMGSVVRWFGLRGASKDEKRKRLGSLAVWWAMFTGAVVILLLGRVGGAITFGLVSFFGLREYFQMLDRKSIDATGRLVVLSAVPVVYGCVAFAHGDTWPMMVLFAVTIGVVASLVIAHKTAGFIASVASLVWGTLVIVFGIAHAPMLLTLPKSSNSVGEAAGWFIYLIVFTQCDDIFQALWGRRIGRRKMTPVVSPNKTYEGFFLGGLTTILLGALLAPLLTPMGDPWIVTIGSWSVRVPFLGVLVSGILMWLAGSCGDLNMSAVKRDVGVKDAGNWLPGQGGILDRVDSLAFTAPVFYYFVRICYP